MLTLVFATALQGQQFGWPTWKAPVSDSGDLPTCNASSDGHARATLDDGHIHVCDGSSWIDNGAGASVVETDRLSVGQTAHGFSANQWLMFNGTSDTWELLDSSSVVDGAHEAIGFVRSVEDVNNFTLSVGGSESWVHGFALGTLYASSTPGVLTATAPPLGEVEWVVAVAADTGNVIIIQREWLQR